MPVDGPARCTSTMTSGSSSAMASEIVSPLSATPGPDGGGDAERAAVGGAERRADRGDLVLGLHGRDAEPLVLAQLVQDVRGRGDRVGAEEDRQLGPHAGGDQAQRERRVAGDVAVGAGRHLGRLDLVADREVLGGLAEVPAGLERGDVGRDQLRPGGELALQEARASTRAAGSTSSDSRPSANMFLARSASFLDMSRSASAPTVIEVSATGCTA